MNRFDVGDTVFAAETEECTAVTGVIVAIWPPGFDFPYQVRVDGETALYSFSADELTLVQKEYLN